MTHLLKLDRILWTLQIVTCTKLNYSFIVMYSVINMGIPDNTMLLLMVLCITCSSTMIYQYQGHFIGFMIISKLHGFFMLLSTL